MSIMGLPRPGHENDYYILHLEGGPGFYDRRRLILSLVKEATGPQSGSVAFKNKPLIDNAHWLEFIQATRHANGRDWWVVTSDADSISHQRTFYTFFLGADTTYLAHTQLFNGYEPVQPAWENATVQRIFTPDGKYLISLDLLNGIRIHAFDRCTGELGPLFTLPFYYTHTTGGGGIAVSPNSRFLYANTAYKVWQYDLWADDIAASIDTVAVYDGFIDPFLGAQVPALFSWPTAGPDGKIYFLNVIPNVHYMAKPNKKGVACDIRQHALQVPVYYIGPPYYPNYRLGPVDGSSCDTLGLNNEPLADFWWFTDSTLSVEFADNSSYEPSEWHWNFGDGGISQDTSPVHLFAAAGTYTVCLMVSNQYAADIVCKQVTVGSTGIQQTEQTPGFRLLVAPNPADERVLIQWPNVQLSGNARLEVYDGLGIRHKSILLNGQMSFAEVQTMDLPAGLYCCRLVQRGRLPAAVKFLVLH